MITIDGNKIIIEQKMSNTGSIYDLASSNWDRIINMGQSYRYAVVLPADHNTRPTRHKTREAALSQYQREIKAGYQGVQVLDRSGENVNEEFDALGC